MYDVRAFGDFGWTFVNAGEEYRKLINVPDEDKLIMLGLFKQATLGDCHVDEAKKDVRENQNRQAWLKYKGIDTIEAMQMYIDKANELVQVCEKKQVDVEEEEK